MSMGKNRRTTKQKKSQRFLFAWDRKQKIKRRGVPVPWGGDVRYIKLPHELLMETVNPQSY